MRKTAGTGLLSIGSCVGYINSGTLELRLGGRNAGQFDRVAAGQVTFGGTLDVILTSGFTPGVADTFDVFTYSSRTGTFATIDGHTETFYTSYGTSTLTLSTAPPASGPQVFAVTNTNDSGAGSLRQAILDANANAGQKDTITFNIPGSELHTIAPQAALPSLTDPVLIDGTTQPGYSGAPLIEMSGASAGPSANGLVIDAGGATVRGLVINRFGANAIVLSSGDNVLEGNFIGTNAAGTSGAGNGQNGVLVQGGPNNRVGGTTAAARNVVSGNAGAGVLIINAGINTMVQGNFVGTDVTGFVDIGNGGIGVLVLGSSAAGGIGGSGI
jgi:hypothetical protein